MPKRKSLQLSAEGWRQIEKARTKKGWGTQEEAWCDFAGVSRETLKRFLAKKAIRQNNFIALCREVGIDNYQDLVTKPRIDLKTSPRIDKNNFFGREQDVTTLTRWIVKENCRFLAITAFGGTGKSSLAKKLAVDLEKEFAGIYWIDLRNAPPIEQVFSNLITFLSDNQEIELPQDFNASWLRLLEYLNKNRWLIIFDNLESLLDGNSRRISYRSDRAEYKQLFIDLATCEYQSTVIVTSREQLPGVKYLLGETGAVRLYRLSGIDSKAVGILRQKVIGTDTQLQDVIIKSQGNPLAINVAALAINEVYQGDIEKFLAEDRAIFGDFEELLDRQWQRLSDRERSLMYGLALNREPINLKKLKDKIILDIKPYEVAKILSSLGDRSLIQVTEAGFALQNVISEYVTIKIVNTVFEEITSGQIQQLNLLNTHCLLEATAPDFIRIRQFQVIIQPILDYTTRKLPEKVIFQRLLQIINQLRHSDCDLKYGFAPGNIINLLVGLETDLTGANFSGLTIRQAYLQQVPLPQVSFRGCHFENTLFSQSLSSILAVAFNPEQTLLATGGTDGYVRLWQVADGKEVCAWQAHSDWIRTVNFSEDGILLASGGNDKVIKVWHWQNQQLRNRLEGHLDWVWTVDFIQQDQLLISTSTDRTAKVWHLATNQTVRDYNELKELAGAAWSVAFSSDRNTFASGTVEEVQLWSLNEQKLIRNFPEASTRVRALCFSPDGKYLAGSNDNQEIVIWQVATGKCIRTLPVPSTAAIWSLKYTPDGANLISCGTDSIQIWDLKNYQCLKTMQQPNHRIRSTAYSEKHNFLAVGSDDQMIGIWDTKKGESVRTILSYNNRIWALESGKINDLPVIASGSDDGKVRIWHATTGELLQTLSGHQGKVRTIKFCPQHRFLASAGSDRTIHLWDLHHLERSPTVYRQHTDLIWQLLFTDGGNTLISFSDDKTILKSNLRSREINSFPISPQEWNWTAAIDQKKGILTLAGDSGEIDLWNIATGKKIISFGKSKNRVKIVTFNTSGNLVSINEDGTIKVWDLNSYKCLDFKEHSFPEIRCSIIIPPQTTRSELVVTAGDDCLIRIYNDQLKELTALEGHQGSIWSLAYCPDWDYLYSCGEDETIKLWNLATGECFNTIDIPKLYQDMDLSDITGISEK
ncbi:MAG: NB-ARC domain-containing protein [Cyanobacteria bacterium P01_A01_bin.83]